MFARSERLEILRQSLGLERSRMGSVDLVVIDGIADLCSSPNDEAESLELVSHVMALAQEFSVAVVCVLHENPGGETRKTRGHLGSELNRKAFANLCIDKDAETSVSTIHGTDMRKRDIPKDQGFCFAWDDAAGMHTFQGRAGTIKADANRKRHDAEAAEAFAEESIVTYTQLVEAIKDTHSLQERAAKTRVKKWLESGAIKKSSDGKYSLTA